MNYRMSLLLAATALSLPALAQAQTNFSRDRNVAVADRTSGEYRPLGLRWGAFQVNPGVDISATTNDNILYRSTNEISDTYFTISPSVSLRSNWGRHALSASLSAASVTYGDNSDENTFQWNLSGAGRLDVHGNSAIVGSVAFGENYEPLYNPNSPQAAAEPVKYALSHGTAGFIAEGNRLRFLGNIDFIDYDYSDVRANNGSILDQDARDFKTTSVNGRAEFALTPDKSIYVTAEANRRQYDHAPVNRNSDGYSVGVGSSFDITHLVRGELQVGYLEQKYKNPAFKPTTGSLFTGRIEYFPTELITVTLDTDRTIEETSDLLASGYLSSSSRLRVDYELLRNLLLSASAGYRNDEYDGQDRQDKQTDIVLTAKYLLSRNIGIKGTYTHSQNDSSGLGAIPGYKANSFMILLAVHY